MATKKNQVSKKVNCDNKSSKLFSLEICIFCYVKHAFQRDPIERADPSADHFTDVVLNVMHTLVEKETSAIRNPFQLKIPLNQTLSRKSERIQNYVVCCKMRKRFCFERMHKSKPHAIQLGNERAQIFCSIQRVFCCCCCC